MDIHNIIAELRRQRSLLDQAIEALDGLGTRGARRGRPPKAQRGGNVIAMPGRRTMSAAARKRISQAMKRRWAIRKRTRARAA